MVVATNKRLTNNDDVHRSRRGILIALLIGVLSRCAIDCWWGALVVSSIRGLRWKQEPQYSVQRKRWQFWKNGRETHSQTPTQNSLEYKTGFTMRAVSSLCSSSYCVLSLSRSLSLAVGCRLLAHALSLTLSAAFESRTVTLIHLLCAGGDEDGTKDNTQAHTHTLTDKKQHARRQLFRDFIIIGVREMYGQCGNCVRSHSIALRSPTIR